MMVPRALVPSLFLLACLLAGCSSSSAAGEPSGAVGGGGSGGSGGGSGGAGGGSGGSAPGESLAAIQKDILSPTCSVGLPCHAPVPGGMPNGFEVYAAMDGSVSSHALYNAIVDKPSQDAPALKLVVAGHPEKSFLFAKIQAKTSGGGFKNTACDPAPSGSATCGMPMPMVGGSLTPAQVTRIETWITQGALDN